MADEKDQNTYPKMLYRLADAGTEHESAPGAGDAVTCQHLIVESEEEEADAKAAGFFDSPAEAGAAAPAKKGAK